MLGDGVGCHGSTKCKARQHKEQLLGCAEADQGNLDIYIGDMARNISSDQAKDGVKQPQAL